jgi:hypothetical protein
MLSTFRNRFNLLFLTLNFALAAPSYAQFAVSGPLTSQLPSAGEPILPGSYGQGKGYEQFEKLLQTSISNGARLLEAAQKFDEDVADQVADGVEMRIFSLSGLHDDYVGHVKEQLPAWAMPLYDYAEGVPESRMLGNLGQVEQPYFKINRELRDPAPDSKETVEWVAKIREALTHLPRFEGVSFRGARLPKNLADQFYPIGKLAQDKAFVSTSLRLNVALRFAFPMDNLVEEEYQKINLIFVIKGKNGRPVSQFADDHDDEAEILFANGTQFRVVAKSGLFKVPEVGARNQIVFLKEE